MVLTMMVAELMAVEEWETTGKSDWKMDLETVVTLMTMPVLAVVEAMEEEMRVMVMEA